MIRACKTCEWVGRNRYGNLLCCLNPPILLGDKPDPHSNDPRQRVSVFGVPDVHPDHFCSHWSLEEQAPS